MEDLINQRLKPTETCIVCTEPFNRTHIPVALPCSHIFGHRCIKEWLIKGQGNTNSCPFCRRAIVEPPKPDDFTPEAIWKALCEQPPANLHDFVKTIWIQIQEQCRGRLSGNFTTSELLDKIVLPALQKTSHEHSGAFKDSFDYVHVLWESLGRRYCMQGLAVPLVRLARLMSQVSSVLPKWLTTVERMNVLIWNANASLGISGDNVDWSHIMEAAKLDMQRYFPLLHLYTALISQTFIHMEAPREWPTRRHEVMNVVVERCCRRIGGDWSGRPLNEFKDQLVVVFEELRRHQLDNGKMSLQGHAAEEHVVTGLWGLTAWRKISTPRAVRPPGASLAREDLCAGWSDW